MGQMFAQACTGEGGADMVGKDDMRAAHIVTDLSQRKATEQPMQQVRIC